MRNPLVNVILQFPCLNFARNMMCQLKMYSQIGPRLGTKLALRCIAMLFRIIRIGAHVHTRPQLLLSIDMR